MIKTYKIQKYIKPLVCCLCLLLTGCGAIGLAQEATFESAYENGEEEVPVDIFTSGATAVVEAMDIEGQTITLYLPERKESRTFTYDNATAIQDQFGSVMTMAQLVPGNIAEITYNSELDKMGSLTLSSEAWSQEGVSKYSLNTGNGMVTVGDNTYSLDSDACIFSEGERIDPEQILEQDVLTIRGKGHNIMSISVDMGHGYLDLVNDEALLGGWIEIGQTIIAQIAPDMLLTVPEGNYAVRLTGSGIEEIREVLIQRNQETVIDLGDIVIPQPEKGRVVFDIYPQDATVYVDDARIDASAYVIRVPYGMHRFTAEASGYDTLSEYFNVEGDTTTVRMELKEKTTVSGNESTSKEETEQATTTIDTPMGAEVYQDNLYMGIAPVTYLKSSGSHTITLRRTGYITRSYAIQIPDDNQSVTYSFPELDLENANSTSTVSGNTSGTSGSSTVSGNTVSGNSVSGNTASN